MDRCTFWIQIHGLPIGLMNENVGIVLGDSLGDVEEVEILEDKFAWGRYMRVRVRINIHKPLKRIAKVSFFGQDPLMVYF
ncbi:hypothetical protein REPUB_Repub17cG0045000 [Reevesia pubescens]